MTGEEIYKVVEEARKKAYVAARKALIRAVPSLKGMVVPREHVEAYVTEARLSALEAIVCSFTAERSTYPGNHDDKTALTLREYWEEVAKYLGGE